MKRFFAALLFLLGFAARAFSPAVAAPAHAATPGYSDWAAVIVAGDSRAHSGKEAEIFDNARRDLAAQFQKIGFLPRNMATFSVHPDKYPAQHPLHSDSTTIANTLWDLANRAKGGCLVYVTSHGSTEGILIGDETVPPPKLTAMINNACGSRPTVAIISSCFSGIFVDGLKAPNRMVLTAARADRTSFGCGEQDTYTFFDTCVLQTLPGAHDFPALAQGVMFCVAQREAEYKAKPEYSDLVPSEPQLFIGESVVNQLPAFR